MSYNLLYTPNGYNTKIAPDMLASLTQGSWLVGGSQNVLISEDGTIESRMGQTLVGQEGTIGGVQWADTWNTNTGSERPMRTLFDRMQVLYNDTWYDLKTGFGNNVAFCGGSWWDRNQNMDRYVFVNGTTQIYSWQGAITEVASRVSATSLKKINGATPTSKTVNIPTGGSMAWGYAQGVTNQVTTNALRGINGVDNFWDAGFRSGDTISITITAIAGTYTVASVNFDTNEILITGTFGGTGSSSTVGQGVTGTVNAYGTSATTWAQDRFPTTGTMSFTMLGVEYTYTGGFNTDTLTGISPNLPATIPANTPVFSSVLSNTPSGGDYSIGATPDVLAVSRNQLYIADITRNWVWLSSQDDFADYAYTVPIRINGEGGSARLEKNVVAIAVNDQDNSVKVTCGTDSIYTISLVSTTSGSSASEEVRVATPKRGTGVGANNQFAICNTKMGLVYLTNEPTIDYLQNVEQFNLVSLPIGHNIETDLQTLDLSNAKTIFWRNYFWLLLPEAGRLYGYDMERKLWQPPQIIDANCLSIINGWLHVHSSIVGETYKLFDGTNDNGAPIGFKAYMNYTNGGKRSEYKFEDGYFVEAKVSTGTSDVTWGVGLGYRASGGVITGTFGSQDGTPFVDSPTLPSGFGGSSIGSAPFGSFMTTDESDFVKVRRIFPLIKNGYEFFEQQVYFECDQLDAQFKILAHGDNMQLSGSHNSNLIKQ